MPRPIILSNGTMAVGINYFGLVHDFYYPYVGLENHDTSKVLRHRIGVWVDGEFSWLDDGSWQFHFDYEDSALIGNIQATQAHLGLRLEFRDCVDAKVNALLREITVINEREQHREVRLMLHQVFQVSNSRSGDTAQYLPQANAILHYKGRRMFVVRAEHEDGTPFDQYAVGVWGIEGHQGTYADAEDGELSGNAVEHGSVDTVVRLRFELEPHGHSVGRYWIAAGSSLEESLDISDGIRQSTFARRFAATSEHWQEWLTPALHVAEQFEDDASRQRFIKSALLLKSHIDHRGAVIASLDTQMLNYARDAYAYCWPRDAVLALWPLVRMGYRDEARAFFDFCRTGLNRGGYLMHKYQADRAIGSSWHPYVYNGQPELPIQEDETALVLFLIGQYHQLTGDDEYVRSIYDALVRPMADFLAAYIDDDTKLPHASYDLWEQKFLTTTFTTAVTYSALVAATQLAEHYGHAEDAAHWHGAAQEMREAANHTFFNGETNFFYKGYFKATDGMHFDDTIDVSSFYGAFMFGLFDADDDRFELALQTLLKTFPQTETFAGLPRYVGDGYNTVDPSGPGNPWFITSLWLAEYYLEAKQPGNARAIIEWVEKSMLPSGVLSEQINPYTHTFVSVAPLTWSQAEYLSAQLDLLMSPHAHEASVPEEEQLPTDDLADDDIELQRDLPKKRRWRT